MQPLPATNPRRNLAARAVTAGVQTDAGPCLPFHVLEAKATDPAAPVPSFVIDLGLRPVKPSKSLWSTGGGR